MAAGSGWGQAAARRLARRDERVTITKYGRPAAVLMSHDEATSMDATLEIMSDPEFYAEILRNSRALDRGAGRAYDLDEIFAEEVSARAFRPPASRPSRSVRGGASTRRSNARRAANSGSARETASTRERAPAIRSAMDSVKATARAAACSPDCPG